MVLMTKPATLWTKTSKQKLLGGRNGDDMQSFFLELYTYTRYPRFSSEGTRIWVNHNMNPKPQSRTFWVTSAEVALYSYNFPKRITNQIATNTWICFFDAWKKTKIFSQLVSTRGLMDIYHGTLRIQSYCQRMIGVSNHLLSMVFWWHCHSQRVIGSYTPEN